MSSSDSGSPMNKKKSKVSHNPDEADEAYEEECVICLEELTSNDEAWGGWGRCIPCNHAFHKKCWWKWENAHNERAQRSRRQGNTENVGGPKCCLCNTVVEQFVDGTGEPAHNPEPFVVEENDPDRRGFFDWLFRRGSDNNNQSAAGQNQEDGAARAREFLERIAQEGGSVMGMDPSVLLDQLRFGGGDWGDAAASAAGTGAGANNENGNNGDGFDFRRLFQQWGPGGAGPFGASTGARQQQEQQQQPRRNSDTNAHEGAFNELRPGTIVLIQDLVNSPHLNGERGKIHQLQRQTGRYLVNLDSNNVTISLKPENLLQIITVKILGLVSQPQFNGREGTIVSYNKERNRYVVRVAYLPSETRDVSIKVSNIRIPDLSKVRLEGLESQPQWNGRYGTIMKWEDGRYQVRLSNMYSVRVKVENVRL